MRQQTATTINTNPKNYKASKDHGIVDIEDLFIQKRGVIADRLFTNGIKDVYTQEDLLQEAMMHFIKYYDADRGENPLSFALNSSVPFVLGRHYRNTCNRYETTVGYDRFDEEQTASKIEQLVIGDITPDFNLAASRFMEEALDTLNANERAVFLATEGMDWHGLSKEEQEELAADCTRIYGREFTYQQIRRAVIGIRTKLEEVAAEHFAADFRTSKRAKAAKAQAECRV